MMEKTTKVSKPVKLIGIKSMREVGVMEREIVDLIEYFDEGIEEDPKAHEKLLKIGERISEKSDMGDKAVSKFLEERKSVY